MNALVSRTGESHTNFQQSFRWSNQWVRPICKIVGPYLLRQSTPWEDQKESTDLIVLRADGLRIAARVRQPGYDQYADEITITCRRESGAQCEWHKMVMQDWGDWFFYGHATDLNADFGIIQPWFLIDLSKARPFLRSQRWREWGPNKDSLGKRCWFYPFKPHQDFPGAIIAREAKELDRDTTNDRWDRL